MNFVIYGNGSSGNHGCEAITRGTIACIGANDQYFIQSANVQDDTQYGLGELAEIWSAVNTPKKDLRFLWSFLKMKLAREYTDLDGMSYAAGVKRASSCSRIALSVGGDNYCYPGTDIYGWLNREYHKNGMKTVLWGCSVEPDVAREPEKAKDLARYDMIVARESITCEALRRINPNTVLSPDPAFFMEPQSCAADPRMESGNVIGINISPHILKCETNDGMAYENYKNLIAHILEHTDSYVALIPHVVWGSNDDRTVLARLYEEFGRDERLILVEDHNAPQLKHIISQCRLFVGARTHATIAAYSSCVPTLVVGYSVKARGIARDLFDTEEGYVLPVQQLSEPQELTKAFAWLCEREDAVRTHLRRFLPGYLESSREAVRKLAALAGEM